MIYSLPSSIPSPKTVGTVVIWPIEIVQAFGVTEAEARVAIDGAMRSIVNMPQLHGDFTPPFYFDT